ncbi:MAG: hypothetical protein IPF99_13710 [Deltaproteobacteria bacterium]|nr:hypothetical protein [Deltaproteobacteria bacterium]
MKAQSKLLIPAKAMHEPRRLVDELRAEKKDATSAGPPWAWAPPARRARCSSSATGMTLSSKLVDAAFPSYEQVIPLGHRPHGDRLAHRPVLDALRAGLLVASDRTSGVKLAGQLVAHAHHQREPRDRRWQRRDRRLAPGPRRHHRLQPQSSPTP